MKNRVGLLRELRSQLVQEEYNRTGSKEYAEAYATKELQQFQYLLLKRSVLRAAVRAGRYAS